MHAVPRRQEQQEPEQRPKQGAPHFRAPRRGRTQGGGRDGVGPEPGSERLCPRCAVGDPLFAAPAPCARRHAPCSAPGQAGAAGTSPLPGPASAPDPPRAPRPRPAPELIPSTDSPHNLPGPAPCPDAPPDPAHPLPLVDPNCPPYPSSPAWPNILPKPAPSLDCTPIHPAGPTPSRPPTARWTRPRPCTGVLRLCALLIPHYAGPAVSSPAPPSPPPTWRLRSREAFGEAKAG